MDFERPFRPLVAWPSRVPIDARSFRLGPEVPLARRTEVLRLFFPFERSKFMTALARCLGAAALGATFLACSQGAFAADANSACAPLSQVQKRVVVKAEQGVDALRDFVYITRGIYRLDMVEIAGSLDGWLANAHCAGIAVDDAAVRRNVALAAAMTPRD
jgi:hypothetical protein